MSTLNEIEKAIEALPPEQWAEIRRWMDSHAPIATVSPVGAMPNFLARQAALFGERVLPDSQAVLDEMRRDRF
jgi:hypothetical protein